MLAVKCLSMSADPQDVVQPLSFFLVDRQEMVRLVVPRDLRRILPKFSWDDDIHHVVRLHLVPCETPGVEGKVMYLEFLVKDAADLDATAFENLWNIYTSRVWPSSAFACRPAPRASGQACGDDGTS